MLYRCLYRACVLGRFFACFLAFGLCAACSLGENVQQPATRPRAGTQGDQNAAAATGSESLDAATRDAAVANDDDAGAGVADTGQSVLPAAGSGALRSGSAGTAGSAGAAGSTGQRDRVACVSDLDAAHLPKSLAVTGALQLSDPALIASDGTFYAFGTGAGIPLRTSTDLLSWQDAGRVFAFEPSWIQPRLEAAPGLWSPDISFFGGLYHLYYAASKQGNNRSCIGHATAKKLPGPFEDQGAVLCSNLGTEPDDWNAIHPNYVEDADAKPYLAFGSFWSGLKLVALDPTTGKPLDRTLIDIAARKQQGGAIEAPFIVKRCDYFYLFASFDRCCDGVNSTYKIYVGRSEQLTGPYLDRDGKPMLQGGGTQVVIGDETWHGPGHSAIFKSADHWYEAHHAYYAGEPSPTFATGQAYLRISELFWDADGWPASGGP